MMTFYGSFSQDITGQWTGILKVQGMQLRVVFNISKTASGYSSTMDSPDQARTGIPVNSTTFENPKLKIEVTSLLVEYTGELKDNKVIGTFKQIGMEFPMNIAANEIVKYKHPASCVMLNLIQHPLNQGIPNQVRKDVTPLGT